MAPRDYVDVQSENGMVDFFPVSHGVVISDKLVKQGRTQKRRVDTLYARRGPWRPYFSHSLAHGLLIVISNVYVHVVVEMDGVETQCYRPAVQVNVSKHDDWLGRPRCDLCFWLCTHKLWLHRVAAYFNPRGNILNLTWPQFEQLDAHDQHEVEADHPDCYVVDWDKCHTVTPAQNDARQARRSQLRDLHHRIKHRANFLATLVASVRAEMLEVLHLFRDHPL